MNRLEKHIYANPIGEAMSKIVEENTYPSLLKYGGPCNERVTATDVREAQEQVDEKMRRMLFDPAMYNLKAQLTVEETNKMTTTSKELNKELTPEIVQEKEVPTHIQVEKLEYANHKAMGEITCINRCEQAEKFRIDTRHARTDIPEKYHNRLKGILRDMRKDQEVILDETAATIAKVNKALG